MSVDFIARCLAASAGNTDDLVARITALEAQLDGLTLKRITKEEFDILDPKDPDTIYFVLDGDKTIIYMGDKKISGPGGVMVSGISALSGGYTTVLSGYGTYRPIDDENGGNDE